MQLSEIEMVREEIADLLRTVPALSGAEVFTRKTGDIESAIHKVLGDVGLSIEVFIKSARLTSDSDEGVVVVNPAVYGVAVFEDVLINQDPLTGTRKGAFFIISQILVALKMVRPATAAGVLEPDEAGPQQGKILNRPNGFAVTQDFSTIVQIVPVNA